MTQFLLVSVTLWFAISGLLVMLENLMLYRYLKRQGVKINRIFRGSRAYVNAKYEQHCYEIDVDPRPRLVVRKCLWVNMWLSGLAFLLYFKISRSDAPPLIRTLASDWVELVYEDGEYYIDPPELSEVGFYEDYFDGVEKAIRIYRSYISTNIENKTDE